MGYAKGILILMSINIVGVCGVIILTGFTGLFSLGHAGFMSIGAYVAAILTKYFGIPFLLSMLIGGLIASLSSLIVGYPTLRGKLKGDYFAIAMMGFAESIRLLFSNIYPYFNGALGLSGIPLKMNLTTSLIICAIVVYFTFRYLNSQHGKLLISIREQEVAAELIGVNVTKEKLKSLLISAFLCGISGGMMAFYYTYMTPLPELLRAVARWRLVIYGLLMIIVMLFRPEGLLGNKEISLYPFIKRIKKEKKVRDVTIKEGK